MTTISGKQTLFVTLTSASPYVTLSGQISGSAKVPLYHNLYVGDTIGFWTAVYGPIGTAFTVVNEGVVTSSRVPHGEDVGILLGTAGTVTNAGTIRAQNGIIILGALDGSYVYNKNSISVSSDGIYLFGKYAQLVNEGDISAGSVAVDLIRGGYVLNTGSIVGSSGISVRNTSPMTEPIIIDNFGEVYAASAGVGILASNGSVTNSGHVIGETGISIAGAGFVYNYGQVSATSFGINTSGYLYNSGTVQASGADGYGVKDLNASLINFGFIEGSLAAADIGTQSHILNYGFINSTNAGIESMAWPNGTAGPAYSYIYNSGSIVANCAIMMAGGQNVSYVYNLGIIIGGAQQDGATAISFVSGALVVNRGTIEGENGAHGMVLGAGSTVRNAGLITSGSGIGLNGPPATYSYYGNSYVYNSGTISSDSSFPSVSLGGYGVALKGLTRTGSVVNVGVIDVGSSGTGIYLESQAGAYNYGTIIATSGIVSNGGRSAYVYNSGTILSDSSFPGNPLGGYGVALQSLTKTGSVVNVGIIDVGGGGTGIYLESQADAYNYGTIIATAGIVSKAGRGAYVYNAGTVIADGPTYGTLQSDIAIAVLGGGTLVNFGLARSSGYGAVLGSGGLIDNGGSIYGETEGINAIQGGTVDNDSQVVGSVTGVYLASVSASAPAILSNQKNDTIFGKSYGVRAGAFDQYGIISITNWGSIIGAVGIAVSEGGTVVNDGYIYGTLGGGIRLSAAATVINEGTIRGGVTSVSYGPVTVISRGYIAVGRNTASVSFANSTDDVLILYPTSELGSNASINFGELVLAGRGGTFNQNSSIHNVGLLQVDPGASWQFDGHVSIYSAQSKYGEAQSFSNAGSVMIPTGSQLLLYGTMDNSGYITSSSNGSSGSGFGDFNFAVGELINSGTILGGIGGQNFDPQGVTLYNSGKILNSDGIGVELESPAQLTNQGIIGGSTGAVIADGGTLYDKGTITGASYAIYFSDGGYLALYPSSSISGKVGLLQTVLELGAGSGSYGTIPFGTQFLNVTEVDVLENAAWSFQGYLNAPMRQLTIAKNATVVADTSAALSISNILDNEGVFLGIDAKSSTAIDMQGYATLYNAGIIGGGQYAILATLPSEIILSSSGTVIGGINLGTNPLTLVGGGATEGTIGWGPGQIVNGSGVDIKSASADWNITYLPAGKNFSNYGTLQVKAGDKLLPRDFFNNGLVNVGAGASLDLAQLYNQSGIVSLAAGSQMNLGGRLLNDGVILNSYDGTPTELVFADVKGDGFGPDYGLFNNGVIVGDVGIIFSYSARYSNNTFSNSGTILSNAKIEDESGVLVTNTQLLSFSQGISITNIAAQVSNSGIIEGGISLATNANIRNTGTIGGNRYAVYIAPSLAAEIQFGVYSEFDGLVHGGGNSTLDFEGPALLPGAGSLGIGSIDLGSQFSGFSSIYVASNSTLDIANALYMSCLKTNGIALLSGSESATIATAIGSGTVEIGPSPLTVDSGAYTTLQFSGADQVLSLQEFKDSKTISFRGDIANFSPSDTIDLSNVLASNLESIAFSAGVLTLYCRNYTTTDGGEKQLTFSNPGSFAGYSFGTFVDGDGIGITLSSATTMSFLKPMADIGVSATSPSLLAEYPAVSPVPKSSGNATDTSLGLIKTTFLNPTLDALPMLTLNT